MKDDGRKDFGMDFPSVESAHKYIALEVAEFVRDNMFELNQHPMDYQAHFDYVEKLFLEWVEAHLNEKVAKIKRGEV